MKQTISMLDFHNAARQVMAANGLGDNTTYCTCEYIFGKNTKKVDVKFQISFFLTDNSCETVKGNTPEICVERMKLTLKDIACLTAEVVTI